MEDVIKVEVKDEPLDDYPINRAKQVSELFSIYYIYDQSTGVDTSMCALNMLVLFSVC